MIADGAYGSLENESLAKDNNIELVTTSLTGPKVPEIFADFELGAEGTAVEQCPAGNAPLKQGYNPATGNCRVVMEKDQCENCPHKDACNPKMQKNTAVVNVSASKVGRAQQSAKIGSSDYEKYRNQRNAIEGIPSILRRKYRIDEMPVFGLLRSKLLFALKIGAINFKKLFKYTRAQSAHL